MNLRSWAELLCDAPWSSDVVGLHVMDTVVAFLAGARTKEGQALSRLYGGRAERVELAAGAAAIARLSECDDIHLASCVTPGSVVMPVALALADGRGENDFNRAVAAGYAAGLRLGIGLGGARALAGGAWPTLVAAPLMAAVTASRLAGHDWDQLAHAMALALAGAGGRPGRPAGTPSGRWFLLGEAVARGIRASEAAGQGFKGDLALVSKTWRMAQVGHEDVDIGVFEASASMPSISDVGFKPFPIARQGANAVAAFQRVLSKGIDPHRIDTVDVFVPAINLPLLSRPVSDDERLSRLCNIGFQLACAGLAPDLLYDSERKATPALLEFAKRVAIAPSHDLEAHLPCDWAARVVVKAGQARFDETVIRTDFDAGAPNLVVCLREKWGRLVPDQGGLASRSYAELWQQIERHVTMDCRREG